MPARTTSLRVCSLGARRSAIWMGLSVAAAAIGLIGLFMIIVVLLLERVCWSFGCRLHAR